MRASGRPDLRVDGLLGVAAALVAWLVLSPFAPIGLDAHHDGIILKPSLDVAAGQTLFRDTFCQYGALAIYVDAAALRLFGETLLVLRRTTVALYALAAGVLVLCWRFFLPRPLALLAFGLWLLCVPFLTPLQLLPWPSVAALLFQSLALLFLLLALRGPSAPLAFAAGVCGGLTVLSRQPVGMFTVAALAASFGVLALPRAGRRASGRALVGCLTGTGVVLVAFLAQLASTGALRAWFEQTVLWPRRWLALDFVAASRATMPLLPFARHAVRVVILVVAVICPLRLLGRWPRSWSGRLLLAAYGVAVGLLAVRWMIYGPWTAGIPGAIVVGLVAASALALASVARAPSPDAGARTALGAHFMCLAAWMQMYPIPDPHHVFWAISPALGIVLAGLWRAVGGRPVVVALLALSVWLPHAVNVVRGARTKLGASMAAVREPAVLAGIRLFPADAARWETLGRAVAGYLAGRPQTPMLVEGPDALVATVVPNRRNPGPFFVVWPGLDTGDLAARVAFLVRERPLVFQQLPPREPLRGMLEAAGYAPLVRMPTGTLLAPSDGRP